MMVTVKFKKPYKGILSNFEQVKQGKDFQIDLEAIDPIKRVHAEATLRAMATVEALEIVGGYEFE